MTSSNVTLYTETQDLYLKYGLQHFLKKYRLSLTDDPRSADIYLGPLPSEHLDSRVQIIFESRTAEGLGYGRISGEKFPLFQKPVPTSQTGSQAEAVFGNQAYPCLSINLNRITIGFDLFSEVGRFLAGYYDNYFLSKNPLGAMLRATPVVDILEDSLAAVINQVLPGPLHLHRFTWPQNHNFALVVTHDVDRVNKTYQYLPSIIKSIRKADLSELGYHLKNLMLKHGTRDPYWTFESLCRLEESQGIKSTYYFLNERGRLNPFSLKSWILYSGRYQVERDTIQKNIRRLSRLGHEIGVHGSYNSFQTSDLLMAEKRTLESITGAEIMGIRQHHLNYDKNSTPSIHTNCGFKYDTTIGFKPDDGVGFRRGTSFPFQIMLPDGNISPLLEIPLIIMDVALNTIATVEECLRLVDQVENHHGILTILWHSNSLNKREFPQLFEAYHQIVDLALARGAGVVRAADVYEWMSGE